MPKSVKQKLELQKIEIFRRVFNNKNQIIEETIEYWYPPEKETKIGFKT